MISGVLTGIGQLAAFLKWKGLYSITDNRRADFTVSECLILRDNLGSRYVCNPAHLVTDGSYVMAGLLIVAAAGVIAVCARREGHTALGLVISLMGAAGVFYAVAGLIPYDRSQWVHDVLMMLFAAMIWILMAVLAGAGSFRRDSGADPHPLVYGAYIPITRLMLMVSIVGMTLLLVFGSRGLPGGAERLAFDTIMIWLVVIGVAMNSLGGAADQESRRVAEMEAQWGVTSGGFGAGPPSTGRQRGGR